MNVRPRQLLLNAFKLYDLWIMALSFFIVTVLLHFPIQSITFQEFLGMRITLQNLTIFLGLLCLWYWTFCFFDLYQSRRLSSQINEVGDVIKATTCFTVILWAVSVIFNMGLITFQFLSGFWALSNTFLILSRLALRHILKLIRVRGKNMSHVVIIGTNQRALDFADKISAQHELGYHLVGFVDDPWEGMRNIQDKAYSVVSDINEFINFLRNNVVDEVFVFIPVKTYYDEISKIVACCEEQGVIVRIPPALFDLKVGNTQMDSVEPGVGHNSLVTVYTGAMRGWEPVLKRVLDICVSSFMLVLLSPILGLVALAIKLDSKGPVLFKQKRLGLNKRVFHIYKFRSMVQDAEKRMADLEKLNEVSGPVFKIKKDPRITPLGRFIRKTSLDELPQLINVFKGDMSLVGPRPLPLRDCEGFEKDWHRRRFSVKPGITCLWQIQGRNSIPFEQWMELDMQYIDKWSLTLDLLILVKTIPVVIRGSNAA